MAKNEGKDKQSQEQPKEQPAPERTGTLEDFVKPDTEEVKPAEGAQLTGFETSDSTGNPHF